MGQGVSTLSILQALEDNDRGHHHVFDPMEASFDDVGLEAVRRNGLEHRMTFHRDYFEPHAPELPKVKFAFIDASHLFDLTIAAFAMADRRLGLNGVIGFHDTWLPSQQKVIRYILSNRNYRIYPTDGQGRPRSAIQTRLLKPFARLLRPEWVTPWKSLGLPQLAMLQKLGHDERKWNYHRPF